MKSGIGIVGAISLDEQRIIEEVWKSIPENPKPENSLWLIELAGDDAFSEKFLGAVRFEKDIKNVLAQLTELYEPLTQFSLAAVIPRRLLCDGRGELDIGFIKYYLQAATKLFA